jgi:hypothetical protein
MISIERCFTRQNDDEITYREGKICKMYVHWAILAALGMYLAVYFLCKWVGERK